MELIHLIFYACLRLRFLDVETNAGPRRPVCAVCRILRSNVRGLAGDLSDLTVASSQFAMQLCSESLVSDMRHVSELLFSGFGRPVLLCLGKISRARGLVAYVRNVLRSISPTQILVWLWRNAGFWGLWCETELLCVQSVPQA